MGLLDRARALFRTPADRRLEQAASAAFARAPRPSAALAAPPSPFPGGSGVNGPPGRPPYPTDWTQDQPLAPTGVYVPRAGYDDHLYQQFSTPIGYEGFTLDRIRNAVAVHRVGYFYESWALSVAILGFAPILAALQQAVAPILNLKRHVHGGDRGLARLVAREVEEAILPARGLRASPYFPATLLATSVIYQRLLGFSVLQHVDGDPDPETGIVPRYTRVWEPWAVRCNPSPLKWLAITTEGEIEIGNTRHFTLVADEMRPHLSGAVVALGEEALAGKLTQEARNAWIDKNGQIKWVATLPEKVATHGEAGDAFFAAVQGIAGPDGLGIFPYGSTFESVALTRDTSGAFNDALSSIIAHVGMVLVGSPGPIISGAEGVYQAGGGGKWNVRQDLIDRPTIAFVRAVNEGHVSPYVEGNYGEAIAGAKRAGTWVEPCLEIPLDDPEANARIEARIAREKARCEILDMRKASSIDTTQDDADALADVLDLAKVKLAPGASKFAEVYAWESEQKVIAADEIRERKGFGPLPGGAGSVERLAEERAQAAEEQRLLDEQRRARLRREEELAAQRAEESAAPSESNEGEESQA